MPTIPWKSAIERGPSNVIQVSRLELRRANDVPRFLVAALRLRRAALSAPGCVGLSLRARPLRRTFWTLSAWSDPTDIEAFVRSDAHVAVMRRFRDAMVGAHFVDWIETDPSDSRPSWRPALQRLEKQA